MATTVTTIGRAGDSRNCANYVISLGGCRTSAHEVAW